MIISSYLLKTPLNPIIFILLFFVAITLFLIGHNIEGNIKRYNIGNCIQVYKSLR